MRCYEKKLQSQSIDIQRLQEAHSRLRNEQTNCQTMHQQPELVVESLKERQRCVFSSHFQMFLPKKS